MSRLLGAMKLKIREIVLIEQRPVCYVDLRKFEINGEKYEMNHGTFRNNISKLRKAGVVELAFRSKPAYYTIPGKRFSKSMTQDRMGVVINTVIKDCLLRQTPIYEWLKNRPTHKQSLHNIRLTFEAAGIWNIFSKVYPTLVNPDNKDIKLPTLLFFDYIDVIVTIHHTDTVSVTISCSYKPIVVDIKDILQLSEALMRTEQHLKNMIESKRRNIDSPNITIPYYRKWIVKMWHFGLDSIDEYTGKEFHVSFEEGILSDLYRIYTKRMKDGKNTVRLEHQEYPNQEYADALVKKLYPDGHLIDPDKMK
jgi:hypothetical protein